jgi:exosortase/archaeosortase family protein
MTAPLDGSLPAETKAPWGARHPQAVFVVRLAAWLALFLLVTESELFTRNVRAPLCLGIAWSADKALLAFGFACGLEGNALSLGGFEVRVVEDCDGIFLVAVYLAAVLAFPVARGARARFAAAPGLAILLALNWLRVPTLLVIGAERPDWFDFAHAYVAQWGLVIVLVALWLIWATRVHGAPRVDSCQRALSG